MSDFSFFSLFTAGLALFAPLADAYTKPVGDAPKGNPISQPGFMSIVPAGKPFTITWEPTTDGTVSLVLLKGPSENAVPQYAIVEKIPNDGTYDWVPKKNLEPTDGAEGYGIQLICDQNGQYQYTTQFGISNPSYKASDESKSSTSESSSTEAASSTASAGRYGDHGRDNWNGHGNHGHGGWGHGGHNVHGGYTHPAAGSASSTGTASGMSSTYTHKSSNNGTMTGGHAKPTGYMSKNVTMVQPTGGYTSRSPVQSTPASSAGYGASASASGSGAPQATDNGAAAMVSSFGGLVLAAGAAVFAL